MVRNTHGHGHTTDLPGDALVLRLARHFRERAEHTALECGDHRMSYAQLEALAYGVLELLRDSGVRAGEVVPLCLARSPRLVAAELAVLALGATYAPIDQASPPARRRAMLDVLPARHVALVEGPAGEELLGWRAVDVTRAQPLTRGALRWSSPAPAPAYVMFTSGSTGVPKAVQVPRAGIERLVLDPDYVALSADARWAFLSSPAFDASTLEVWAPLASGATCVISEVATPSLESLASWLRDARITEAWLTSALFNALVEDRPDALRGLRQLLIGGERLSPRHVVAAQAAHPALRLINGYGPTENTTFSTCHTIGAEDLRAAGAGHGIPIGRPIRGSTARIGPDDDARGELWVGGLGVAHGYLGDPALTAERFVEHAGQRWYRTGDVAQRRADGVLEYLGRADRQVKLSGHRVELDEVEHTLRSCPGVSEVVVEVVGEEAHERSLTAYFTTLDGAHTPAPTTSELGEYAARHLSPAAIPRRLVQLARLPRSANGKIDRAELRAQAPTPPPPPTWTSAVERGLADLWSRCLGVPVNSSAESFVELGGTSLAALRVAGLVQRRLGRRISPIDVLQVPVLADQARLVERAPLASLLPQPAEGPPLLSERQQATLRISALDPTGCAMHVHVPLVLEPSAPPAAALRQAFAALWSRHPILQVAVELRGDELTTSPLFEPAADWWTEHPALDAAPADLAWPEPLRAVIDRPLDTRRGPLRVDYWPLPAGRALLVWTAHHFVLDEASIVVALDELSRLLRGEPLGSPTTPGALATTPIDEVTVKALAAAAHAALAGHAAPLPRPPAPGDERPVSLASDLDGLLQAACARWHITPFAPLLTALGLALQDELGEAHRFVLTPFQRRTRAEQHQALGYALDVRLVEAGARPGESAADTLARVQAAVLVAQQPTLVPIEHVAAVVAERDVRAAEALTQFMLTWRVEPTRRVPLGHGTAQLIRAPQRGARAALCVHAARVGGQLALSVEAPDAVHEAGVATRVVARLQDHLRALCALPRWSSPTTPPPPDDDGSRAHQRTLAEAWARWLGAPPRGPDDGFLLAGGTSLIAMRLAAELARRHQLTLDVGRFLGEPTFAALCALTTAGAPVHDDDLVVVGPRDAREVYLVLPGKVGTALGLVRLAEHLREASPPSTAVAIVELDRIVRRAPEQDVTAYVQDRLEALVSAIGPERVVGLVGFSLGGLLVPRLLHRLHELRAPLWLLDVYAPGVAQRGLLGRAERRLAWGLWGRRPSAPIPPPPDVTAEAWARWQALEGQLTAQPWGWVDTDVVLVQASETTREVGLVWRRESNGLVPGEFRSLRVVRVVGEHLELTRSLAAKTAQLIASTARERRGAALGLSPPQRRPSLRPRG